MTKKLKSWRDQLTEWEAKEVRLAQVYATDLAHGTDGHSRLMLIYKLAGLLNKAEREGKL